MNEVVEMPQSRSSALNLVTRQDLDSLKQQKAILKDFIKSQLKEASFSDSSSKDYGEGDYGVIPGTKKKSLLKPGAEKILRLFGLGFRIRLADKEINRKENFAMFTYRCEVYHLQTNIVIAECEASVNSQEKKYRERTVWKKKTVNGKTINESSQEETPICDILNTLMKMSQKRALVGAVLVATAASDYFTQDMELDEDPVTTQQNSAADKKTEAPKTAAKPSDRPKCSCGKEMMVSQYPNKESGLIHWYCTKCKKSGEVVE